MNLSNISLGFSLLMLVSCNEIVGGPSSTTEGHKQIEVTYAEMDQGSPGPQREVANVRGELLNASMMAVEESFLRYEASTKTSKLDPLINDLPDGGNSRSGTPPTPTLPSGNFGQLGMGLISPPSPRFFGNRDKNAMAPIQNDEYTVPMLPPHNTSNDGRIAFNPEVSWNGEFYLNVPEKLTNVSLLDAGAGVALMADNGRPFGVSGMETCIRHGLPVTVINGAPHGVADGVTIVPGWEHGCVSPGNVTQMPEGNPRNVSIQKVWMWPRPNNSDITIWSQTYADQGWSPAGHYGICDPGAAPNVPNPSACTHNGQRADCYTLDVIVPMLQRQFPQPYQNTPSAFRMKSMRFMVKVARPKTSQSQIVQVSKIPYPEGEMLRWTQTIEHRSGPTLQGVGAPGLAEGIGSFFEPIFTADGKLFVGRIGGSPLKWSRNDGINRTYNDNTTEANRYLYDIVYASIPANASPCDIRALTPLRPITYAPKDPEVKHRYPFAFKPFRDATGRLLADDADPGLTYPWIDRMGKNLFFTSMSVPLHFEDTNADDSHVAGRAMFPTRCVGGSPLTREGVLIGPHKERCRFLFKTMEDMLRDTTIGGGKNGVGAMGSWTNGKVVLFDGNINPIDFALMDADALQREIALYRDGRSNVFVRVGASIVTGMREKNHQFNINLIQSIENLFNYRFTARPKIPRDVVWTMTTGRGIDEVVFDDYVDPNVLIYSDMTPAIEILRHSSGRWNDLHYRNGITYQGWYRNAKPNGQIKLQNAATGFGGKFNPPAAGIVSGVARAEPVALGGYRGKGFWLSGANQISYPVPDQPALAGEQWSYMLFLDNRQGNRVPGRLLTFPNGSRVEMFSNSELNFLHSDGSIIRQITIPENLRTPWTHLAFSVETLFIIRGGIAEGEPGPMPEIQPVIAGGEQTRVIDSRSTIPRPVVKVPYKRVSVYWNGHLLQQFDANGTYRNAFHMQAGDLILGSQSMGFRGWIDEFKVISRALNPEEYCNHAYGTMVGVAPSANLWATAASYPAESHSRVRQLLSTLGAPASTLRDHYACYTNLATSELIHVEKVPANTVAVRKHFLHHEGQVVWNRPRPDSTGNQFCISCHLDGGDMGMAFGMAALTPGPVPAHADPRRQPLAPPSRVWGIIPSGFPGAGFPAGPQGFLLDNYIFPVPRTTSGQ
jgi:hypothetical protein